jgi:hypothetical protein
MNNLNDYRVRFFDGSGAPLEDRSVEAESLTIVIERAAEIASEIAAADFSIMLLPPKLLTVGKPRPSTNRGR